MDKEWAFFPRNSAVHQNGVHSFLNDVLTKKGNPKKIICPCKDCLNMSFQLSIVVYDHLIEYGFDPTYDNWIWHGEKSNASLQHEAVEIFDVYRMYRDAYFQDDGIGEPEHERIEPNFISSLEDAELPSFSSCTKYTKMIAVVVLYKFKDMHGLTDSGYNDLLQILSDMLPDENTLPDSLNSTKKILKTFDLGYEKIDACVNDYCLFWKDQEHLETCPTCDASRWKTKKIHKGIPAKVLHYCPIIPTLRRMFRSPEKAEQLLWHSKHKSKDGKMRHLVDSPVWERIDCKYPNFASDPKNLRFALSSDGFNHFADLSSRYSVWPVVLVTYNLPPSLCMSKDNVILSLLIPGKEQPGNDIDVYLEPLVDDLKKLWNNGIEVYEACGKSMFNLKDILMWTISDFLAYGNLSGHPIKGKVACPICDVGTCSLWLDASHKFAYMGHIRFLAHNHPFITNEDWYDGKEEHGVKPRMLNGLEISQALND